jgi:hypothetical protein
MSPSRKTFRTIALAVLCSSLTGCVDYLDRRDTISLSAGDAVAANLAIQTIDPWPAEAARHSVPGNGKVVAAAVDRYNNGQVTPPQAQGTSAIAVQVTPPPVAPPSNNNH